MINYIMVSFLCFFSSLLCCKLYGNRLLERVLELNCKRLLELDFDNNEVYFTLLIFFIPFFKVIITAAILFIGMVSDEVWEMVMEKLQK